jgi:hypothetical protein
VRERTGKRRKNNGLANVRIGDLKKISSQNNRIKNNKKGKQKDQKHSKTPKRKTQKDTVLVHKARPSTKATAGQRQLPTVGSPS